MVTAAAVVAAFAGSARADHKSSDPNRIVLNVAGDIAWPNGWYGMDKVDKQKHRLFRQVQSILDSADLNFANIECPLTKVKPTVKKRYPISCKPKRARYFLNAGFNMLSLANNHAYDTGQRGIDDTLALLERERRTRKRLWWSGTSRRKGNPRTATRIKLPGKNVTISLFAVAAWGGHSRAYLRRKSLPRRIHQAAQHDVVIVSVHNGPEYHHVPYRETTRRYRALIDAGASLVVAHHPHVVQGVERYKNGFIFYSMGNFSFGSRTRRNLKTGARMYSLIGRITFAGKRIERVELIPLYANNRNKWVLDGKTIRPRFAVPQLLSGTFAAYALDELATFSRKVPGARKHPTKLVRIGDRAFVDLGTPISATAKRKLLAQQRREYRAVGDEKPRPATRAERHFENRGGTPVAHYKHRRRR